MVSVGISELINQDFLTLPLFSEEIKQRDVLEAMDRINDQFGDFTIGRASYADLMPWEKTTAGMRNRLNFKLF